MADNLVTDLSGLTPAQQRTIRANAEAQQTTPEAYLQSRGGVNPVTGKYGDSTTPYELSNEEYLAARAGGGQAINAATAKKNYQYLIEQGYTPEQAAANSNWSPTGGYAPSGGGGTTKGGGAAALANYNTQQAASTQAALDKAARQSAYDILLNEFSKYGLSSLVEGIKSLIQENVSPSEFAIRLQNTKAYQDRFSANQERIKQGLRALTPAEYIGLEDQYQNIMRNYGLPASYYSKDSMGTQAGFNKFIANDVSAAELEDRIATAQKRVMNADPAVTDALRQFYPDITKADILAYTLDPTNALENIKRKVTAAEIGGAALQQGLGTSAARAEELAKYGITKAQAQQGYGQIGEFLPTAQKLGDIYSQQGAGPYDQLTAEAEVFGTAGSAEAARKRRKLAQLEQAAFGGSAGTSQSALNRERSITSYMVGQPGAGQF